MVRHSMSAITMVTLLSVIRTDTCQHSDSAEKFVPRILNLENCQMRMQIYYEGSKSASWIYLTPENLQESPFSRINRRHASYVLYNLADIDTCCCIITLSIYAKCMPSLIDPVS